MRRPTSTPPPTKNQRGKSLLERSHELRLRADRAVASAPALLRSKLSLVGELAELLVDIAQHIEDRDNGL